MPWPVRKSNKAPMVGPPNTRRTGRLHKGVSPVSPTPLPPQPKPKLQIKQDNGEKWSDII